DNNGAAHQWFQTDVIPNNTATTFPMASTADKPDKPATPDLLGAPLVVGSYLPLKKATFAQSNVVPPGTPNVTVTNPMSKYEMMMVDDEGFESAPIFLGSMDLSAGNTITINNLWAVTGSNIVARKFYRTDAGGTTYQYIGATTTAADTTFTDNDLYVPNPTG